jgi:hypothetical protein
MLMHLNERCSAKKQKGSEASDFRTRQRALILQNQQQPQQSGSTTPAQPGTNPQPQL